LSVAEAREETDQAWRRSYSPERNLEALDAIGDRPLQYRISHLVARLFFRGIYFPQMNKRAWLSLLFQNRKAIYRLVKEAIRELRRHRRTVRGASISPADTPAPAFEPGAE